MKRSLSITTLASVLIVCLFGTIACGENSPNPADEVSDIVVHKGEVTHTEQWETLDNKGIFTGYRSVVRGTAENAGKEPIYRPYIRLTIIGPDSAELGQDTVPLGLMEPGETVNFKSEVVSNTSYAVDFEWELIPWPEIATAEQLEASQWDEYNTESSPAAWPMITGSIVAAIAVAVTVFLFIILRRRRKVRRATQGL